MALRRSSPSLLAFAAATALYLLIATLAPPYPAGGPVSHLFQPASGVALAMLLLGGRRLGLSVLIGAGLAQALTPDISSASALSETLAATTAALLGAELLLRLHSAYRGHRSFHDQWQLLAYAGGIAAGLGALVYATALLAAGQIHASTWPRTAMHWWMGNALGTVLVSTLLLAWWNSLQAHKKWPHIAEGWLLYGLALAAGQVIFLHWQQPWLAPIASGYWMFLFIAWAGVRLGMLGTVGLLCLVALQALAGTAHGSGFFATDLLASHGFGFWSYMVILSLVGLSLAAYVAEHERQNARLRIAAIAFECQEGLLITDAHQVILKANQSFLAMSGYTVHEVLGQTPYFLRAPTATGPSEHLSSAPVQREEWLRRKNGSIYPAQVGITPVHDSRARTTHYVLTMVDITHQHEQQAQHLAREKAHRDALVREVHHRIKNNLQGILGMLQGFEQTYPQLHGPLAQLMGQVQSIAVIHGLQGSAHIDQVLLCELLRAMVAGQEALWQTPVQLAIAPGVDSCLLQHSEAVPVALILNELILNAIKHGGKEHQDVHVALHPGPHAESLQISISNPHCHCTPAQATAAALIETSTAAHLGLDLVAALMPRSGATLSRQHTPLRTVVQLTLQPPVIQLETSDTP